MNGRECLRFDKTEWSRLSACLAIARAASDGGSAAPRTDEQQEDKTDQSNHQRSIRIGVLMVIMLVITLVYNREYVSYSDQHQGMSIRLVIEKTAHSDELAQKAFFEFKRVVEKYTTQYAVIPVQSPEDGLLTLDEETLSLVNRLATIAEYSGGLYDYTLGNLALLYETSNSPSESAVEQAMEQIGFYNVAFSEEGIKLFNHVKFYLKPVAVAYAMDCVVDLLKRLNEKQTGYIQVDRNLAIIGERNASTDWMDTLEMVGEEKILYLGKGGVWRGRLEELTTVTGDIQRSKYEYAMVISDTTLQAKTALMALSALEKEKAAEYINKWSLIGAFRYEGQTEFFNGFEGLFVNDNKVME